MTLYYLLEIGDVYAIGDEYYNEHFKQWRRISDCFAGTKNETEEVVRRVAK